MSYSHCLSRYLSFVSLLSASVLAVHAQTPIQAINLPDKFNWELFANLNAPAPNGKDRVWETWADNQTTFPDNPSRSQAPQFPSPLVVASRAIQPIRQLQFLQAELKALGMDAGVHPLVALGGGEEVRRNKEGFDFIVAKKLWFKEGLAEAFSGEKLSFPPGAIEVKAAWGPPISSATPSSSGITRTQIAMGNGFACLECT